MNDSGSQRDDVRRVSGLPVFSGDHGSVLEAMDKNIRGARESRYICITNTESMYYARRIQAHREHVEQADYSLCDGVGVVLAGAMQGQRIVRFNGPELVLEACEFGASRGWRHYFCGGKDGVAELLAARLGERFPGMVTAGTFCPPFREMTHEEEQDMVAAINRSAPDVLWVGLGLLKQEAWIRRYRKELAVPWLAGVGAAFDFHAGTARRAPAWIRRIGFEWLYRLCLEPRMFRRNVNSFVFLLEAGRDALAGARHTPAGQEKLDGPRSE